MSHRKSYNVSGHAHFLTFSCFQRQPFLRDDSVCQVLISSLNEARQLEQFDLWAYVLMPEHVHLLIMPRHETYEIASILRRIKEPVARRVLAVWKHTEPALLSRTVDSTRGPVDRRFWQPGGGFDRNILSLDAIGKTIEYIEWNPIRRELAATPEEWKWSSARARAGVMDVPLAIDPVEPELLKPSTE